MRSWKLKRAKDFNYASGSRCGEKCGQLLKIHAYCICGEQSALWVLIGVSCQLSVVSGRGYGDGAGCDLTTFAEFSKRTETDSGGRIFLRPLAS
jgi:hypothetical protein